MKAFVITIMSENKSVEMAQRCCATFKRHNPDHEIEVFTAITPEDQPFSLADKWKIPLRSFMEKYSRYDRCVSAFLSHMSLWKKCIVLNEPIIIFEHDAITVAPIRISYPRGIINIGKPSYGKFKTPQLGIGPLVSKQYLPGAHAYVITPQYAKLLCEMAIMEAAPTDIYINNNRFAGLQEMYPWPVECDDTFTTIQNETGCLAKHNYGGGRSYEII